MFVMWLLCKLVQLGQGRAALVVLCTPFSVLGLGLSCVQQLSLYHSSDCDQKHVSYSSVPGFLSVAVLYLLLV